MPAMQKVGVGNRDMVHKLYNDSKCRGHMVFLMEDRLEFHNPSDAGSQNEDSAALVPVLRFSTTTHVSDTH